MGTALVCLSGPQVVACPGVAGTAEAVWAIGKNIIDAGFQYTERDGGYRAGGYRAIAARFVLSVTVDGVLGLVGIPNTIFGGLDSSIGDAADAAWQAYDVAFNQACNAAKEVADGKADFSSASFNLEDLPPNVQDAVKKRVTLKKGPGFFEAAGEEAAKRVSCGLMQTLSAIKGLWSGAAPSLDFRRLKRNEVPYPEIQEQCDFPSLI